MRLITLLNHCEHFSGFVYEKARLCQHSRTIEIEMRPRRGSKPVCSGCHERGTAYDQLGLRRFEFVPVWGFIVLLLYRMRRVFLIAEPVAFGSKRCRGRLASTS